jgi:hypothetical protein
VASIPAESEDPTIAAAMHALSEIEPTDQEAWQIHDYLVVMCERYKQIFIHTGMGTQMEKILHEKMKNAWESYSVRLKKLISTTHKAGLMGVCPPGVLKSHVQFVHEEIGHARRIMKERTIDLIKRRWEGDEVTDEDPSNPSDMIHGIHEKVVRTDLPYKNFPPSFFHQMYVRLPIPIIYEDPPGLDDAEVEYVWAHCKGTIDGSSRTMLGVLVQCAAENDHFQADDKVEFLPEEVHDVASPLLQPTETLTCNHTMGLNCMMWFWMQGAIAPMPDDVESLEKAWFRMSDREKLHIINFHNEIQEENKRIEQARKGGKRI